MTTKKKSKVSPESIVREIKRRTRRKFTAEDMDLVEVARKRSRKSGFQKMSEFVTWTIDRVEEMVLEE